MIADGSDGLGVACCDPNASFDQFGNYFLVYLDSRAKKVQVAYSIDGGTTMQYLGAIDHTDHSGPQSNGKKWGAGVDQPSLATGPGGTWFVYKMFAQGGQLLQVRGLPVTGLGQFGSLSPSKGVPGSKPGSFGDIVVGDTGQVVVTYQARHGRPGSRHDLDEPRSRRVRSDRLRGCARRDGLERRWLRLHPAAVASLRRRRGGSRLRPHRRRPRWPPLPALHGRISGREQRHQHLRPVLGQRWRLVDESPPGQ